MVEGWIKQALSTIDSPSLDGEICRSIENVAPERILLLQR
jgi:hypothetical protein